MKSAISIIFVGGPRNHPIVNLPLPSLEEFGGPGSDSQFRPAIAPILSAFHQLYAAYTQFAG
jgi:hypothetical protein